MNLVCRCGVVSRLAGGDDSAGTSLPKRKRRNLQTLPPRIA